MILSINPLGKIRVPRGIWAILLCMLLLQGCARFRGTIEHAETLQLRLNIGESGWRPQDALVATAELSSLDGKRRQVQQLNAGAVQFYWWPAGAPDRLIRRPVTSLNEDVMEIAEIAPGIPLTRPFVFTDVTPTTGTFHMQAIYRNAIARQSESSMAVSPVATYAVSGAPVFQRRTDGLLSQADAVRLAQEKLGAPTTREEAVLVRNPIGFHEWMVRLTVDPSALSAGGKSQRIFFVQPYVGTVREGAE